MVYEMNKIEKGLGKINLRSSEAVDELRNRSDSENFDVSDYKKGDFGELNDKVAFIQLVYTGYIKDHFYKSEEELLDYSFKLHKKVAMADEKFHSSVILKARSEASIKDQVIIGIYRNMLLSKNTELLSTLPTSNITKLIEWKKPYKLHETVIKNIIKSYLSSLDEDRLKLYAVKNRKDIRDMAKYAQYKLPDNYWEFVRHLTDYKSKDKKLMAVRDLLIKHKVDSEKLEGVKLPYGMVKSGIKKENINKIPIENLEITPYQTLSFARMLADIYGDKKVAKYVSKINGQYITSDKWFTAATTLAEIKNYSNIADAMFEQYKVSIKESYKKLLLNFGKKPEFTVLFDISGSMEADVTKCLSIVIPFAPLIKKLYSFNTEVFKHNSSVLYDIKSTLESFKTGGGTSLFGAIKKVEPELGNTDLIIVTDEQENSSYDYDTSKTLLKEIGKEHDVYVINPSPYAAHSILHNVCYLPARNAEGLASVIKYNQLKNVKQDDIIKYFSQSIGV